MDTISLDDVGEKLVPDSVTESPAAAMFGLIPLIVGAPLAADVTVKDARLDAEPRGAVTETVPEVAPVGTTATIVVDVAEVIWAAVPLKNTES